VISRLSDTPGEIRSTGRGHGADTEEVLHELGLGTEELAALREKGVV